MVMSLKPKNPKSRTKHAISWNNFAAPERLCSYLSLGLSKNCLDRKWTPRKRAKYRKMTAMIPDALFLFCYNALDVSSDIDEEGGNGYTEEDCQYQYQELFHSVTLPFRGGDPPYT